MRVGAASTAPRRDARWEHGHELRCDHHRRRDHRWLHRVRPRQARLPDAQPRQAAGRGLRLDRRVLAIIRTHYSTLDGAALAYESYFAWDDWAGYLATADERGLARFVKSGCLVLKTAANGHLRTICRNMDALGIPVKTGGPSRSTRACRSTISAASARQAVDDAAFGEADGGIAGGVYFPYAGYINDPQLASHNAERAAEAKGAAFRFNAEVAAIRRASGRVQGVTLASGEEIDAPVVVNVAGPHRAKINAWRACSTACRSPRARSSRRSPTCRSPRTSTSRRTAS